MRTWFVSILGMVLFRCSPQSDVRQSLGLGLSKYGVSVSFRNDKTMESLKSATLKPTGYYVVSGNIQHPREVAVVNTVFQNASAYKVDKINYVWTFRPGLLYSYSLSERTDRRAVGLNFSSGPGVSLAYVWPVYVTVLQVDPFGNEYFTNVRYNPDIHKTTEIAGRAGFSEGFSEGRITPGLTWQGGLDFQWGNYRGDVNTLMLGASVEAFPRKLPILNSNQLNKSVFSSFYISFAFGLGD